MSATRIQFLRWALICFAISAVAGASQLTEAAVRTAEISTLLALAFLIPFNAFVAFEMLALDGSESDSNTARSRAA